ncbi:hypothetical protein [Haloferax sp. Atlit-12N]|nr:hypothetical protein [Haloferax sp. Atlit-12N]
MSLDEAREDLNEVVRKHSSSLDAEDLKTLSADLDSIAKKWEALP